MRYFFPVPMRIRNLAVSVLSLAAASARAADFGANASLGWESRYVFRGAQSAEDVATGAVNLYRGDFYGGIWSAVPLHNAGRHADEADLFAGWSKRLAGVVTVDAGGTFYSFAGSGNDFTGRGDSLEAYAGVATDLLPFAPSLYLYRDFDEGTTTVELKAGHSFALSGSVSVDVSAAAGRVGYEGGGDRLYTQLSAAVSLATGRNSSLSLGARYGLSDAASFYGSALRPEWRHQGFWVGASASCSF